MSFVPKPGGKVRSVVDLVELNKYVERPTHPFPAPRDIIAQIPSTSRCFAVFDALHGYWQIPLDEESKPLTTFITEFGRYRYLRAPMGLTVPRKSLGTFGLLRSKMAFFNWAWRKVRVLSWP